MSALCFSAMYAWMRAGDFDRAEACMVRGYKLLALLTSPRQASEMTR